MSEDARGWAQLPVVVDRLVPLTRKDPKTGEETEILCWLWGERILVNPDNWDAFQEAVANRRIPDSKLGKEE